MLLSDTYRFSIPPPLPPGSLLSEFLLFLLQFLTQIDGAVTYCEVNNFNNIFFFWFLISGPRLNSQSLLEFAHAQEHEGELRIKSALLWVRVELRPGSGRVSHHAKHKNITLFVFRVQPKRFLNTTHLSGKVCCSAETGL